MRNLNKKWIRKTVAAACLTFVFYLPGLISSTDTSFAAYNTKGPWSTEMTIRFTPLWGKLLGMDPEDGDG